MIPKAEVWRDVEHPQMPLVLVDSHEHFHLFAVPNHKFFKGKKGSCISSRSGSARDGEGKASNRGLGKDCMGIRSVFALVKLCGNSSSL